MSQEAWLSSLYAGHLVVPVRHLVVQYTVFPKKMHIKMILMKRDDCWTMLGDKILHQNKIGITCMSSCTMGIAVLIWQTFSSPI